MRLYERYGNIREDEAFLDSGISGIRSFAVDYSGKSGVPCLIAVVDRIDGGRSKVWTWQLPQPSKPSSEQVDNPYHAVMKDNTFTVTASDGAAMHGTFITGQHPRAEVRMTSMVGHAGSSKGKELKRPIYGVFAEGESGRFFVIVSIQRGEPPRLQVEGKGLNATVTVGARVISFDGEKIVLGSED
jgi:hypothetical protein